MESIGEKIYALRNSAGISQDTLAEKLNVSRQTVSRWETDTSKPTQKNIRSLCNVLGVDKNYFSSTDETLAVKNVPQEKCTQTTKTSGLKIYIVLALSVFLLCIIAACTVESYVSFLPASSNGLDTAAANRFKYIGAVCVFVGVIALAILISLLIIVIKNKIKSKK